MKKLLLGIALLTGCAQGLLAQVSGVDIKLNGSGPNMVGTAFETSVTADDLGGGYLDIHFIVTNNTGADKQWQITRKKISVPTDWIDQVCWPPSCFTTSGDLYSTPNSTGNPAPTVLNGTSDAVVFTDNYIAELKPRIKPSGSNNGLGHYRYYITENGQYIDSVDVKVDFTLAVTPLKQNPTIAISPNPASDDFNISLASVDNANVKVVDVLGNIILNETINNGSKNVNVSSFKNGVYFVIVEAPGIKPMNRKLIIRH